MSIALLIACLSLAVWIYLLLARGDFWRVRSFDALPASLSAWPELGIVIPARNEADILAKTLPSLLSNDYPGALRVTLVDDRSEDATADVAARVAAQHGASGLTIIKANTPRADWKGKVNAMQCGLKDVAAAPDPPRYILFTDADIRYDKGALARLVAHAETNGFVLASLMVRLNCRSMAERWLVPAFVYFFRMLYPFDWVNDPKRRVAAAAGGCMLVRYDALMKAGGMEPIRAALIDDCALGRLLKAHGPVWLGLTKEVQSLRDYPGMEDIRAMVARSAYDQLGYSPTALAGALLGMVITYIAPVLLTLFSHGAAQILGALSWAGMALSFSPMLRFYGLTPLRAPALLLVAAFYMAFTVDSALQYRRGQGGLWKGRVQATNGHGA